MDWQTIETAPSGKWVLAYNQNTNWPNDYEDCYWIAIKENGEFTIMLDGQKCNPTHWMPLPKPPN